MTEGLHHNDAVFVRVIVFRAWGAKVMRRKKEFSELTQKEGDDHEPKMR